jgi:hypothetical protein
MYTGYLACRVSLGNTNSISLPKNEVQSIQKCYKFAPEPDECIDVKFLEMFMRNLRSMIVLGCLLLLTQTAFSQAKRVMPSQCTFYLTDSVLQSNTTFSDGFVFLLSRDLKAANVRRVVGNQVQLREASECFSRWSFSGFKQATRFYVYFRWVHGLGWQPIRLRSKGYTRSFQANRFLNYTTQER